MGFEKYTKPLLKDVSDSRVREAFRRIDRARFVPESHLREAWADRALPVEDGATISQPSLVAKMTEWLKAGPDDRVLEIGTGTGYQTAILAELADEVATVEYSPVLARTAHQRLDQMGYTNIHYRIGDGSTGWDAYAPYDRIIATVAFPGRPTALLEQLSDENGIALVPVGIPHGTQDLMLYRRRGDDISEERLLPVRFISLR